MWKKIKSTTLLQHPRLEVAEDKVLLPNGKVIQYIHFSGQSDAAIVVCFRGNKLLVQKEYSYPPNEVLYQFPGGAVEEGELPIEAAKRELHEEANLLAEKLQPLGLFYIDNRRSSAKMHVFLAENPSNNAGKADDEEEITSEWVSTAEFKTMIRRGDIKNFSMLAAWSLFINQATESHS